MLYYTQFIYIKPGREEQFHLFEEKVLPLLARYNGSLLYRVRPGRGAVVETSVEYPYEVHLVAFESKEDFMAYANDDERKKYLALKNESVEKVILIEGHLV